MRNGEIYEKELRMMRPEIDCVRKTDLSADYILPDKYPDVKRILRISAQPILNSRFVSGNRLEYNGAVDYIILFSSDGENDGPECIHSVHFVADFSDEVSAESNFETATVSVEPKLDNCSARLQNPRKLLIKSTVMTAVKIIRPVSTAPEFEGNCSEEAKLSVRKLTEKYPTLICESFIADHCQISENIEPDASQPSIDEIINCTSSIHFHEVKPVKTENSFTATLKGEAVVSCLYKAQSEVGDYRSFSQKIPIAITCDVSDHSSFFENIDADSLSATADGNLTELNCSVSENSYGERRIIELDISYDIDLHLMANRTIPMTLDLYSVEHDSNLEKCETKVKSLYKIINSNFSVGEAIHPEPGDGWNTDEERLNVIDLCAEVRMNECTIDRGRAILNGEAKLNCIVCGKASGFRSFESTVPVKCELSVGDIPGNVDFICSCRTSDLRARIESDRIACDFEVRLAASLFSESEVETVKKVHMSKEKKTCDRSPSTMLLYYPSSDETMWEIAKKYSTTFEDIAAFNQVTEPMPKVLVIPPTRCPSLSRII